MNHIQVGVSALRAAQIGLNTASQNIANASTDGYHRQRVDLIDRKTYQVGRSGSITGGGVDVAQITRLINTTVEQALTANISGREAALTQLATLQNIEQALTPGEGSIHSLLTEFFNRVELLAANPGESVLRREVVSTADQLASAVGQVSNAFDNLNGSVGEDVGIAIETVNRIAQNIADLNRDIRVASGRGHLTNSLLDQRDRLVNELATYVDIDPTSLLNGSDPIIAAGGALIIYEATTTLGFETSETGKLQLTSSTGQRGFDIRSGKLGGLIQASQSIDSGIGADFTTWAQTLIKEIDTIQATGIGLSGPAEALAGTRRILPVDGPLSQAGSVFSLESGELSITVTDSTGQRQTTVVPVDIATDSLRDIVTRIDGISNLTASFSNAGTVALHAAPGFTIDFSGRPDQQPVTSAITGNATPTVSGTFLGAENTTWNAEVISGGEIGVSSDVIVRVTDTANGRVLGDFNFGAGYPANQAVEVSAGVSFTLTPGVLNAGDEFSVRVTSQPDETGLLASLGLNTLFVGNSLRDLSVASNINTDPSQLSASRSGAIGEGRQLDRLIDLRSRGLFGVGKESLEERLASLTGLSGILSSSAQLDIDQRDARQTELENARDSVSGVDPNEELLEMLQYQRAFQAASRFVTSVDETLDDLMRLVG